MGVAGGLRDVATAPFAAGGNNQTVDARAASAPDVMTKPEVVTKGEIENDEAEKDKTESVKDAQKEE
jgi:hypothetical protein